MVMKTTLAQDCKNFNSTWWLQVNHPQLLKQNIYFVFKFWSLEVEYLYKCNVYFCKNTSLLTGGCSTHITSAGARTGIVRCLDGHRPIRKEIFESFWRLSDIVRCPAGYRTVPGRAPLESYDLNFKQKSSGARPMCHFTLNDPTKRRTGAVEF